MCANLSPWRGWIGQDDVEERDASENPYAAMLHASGGYELIVLDDEEVVFRGIVNGGTYLTPSGPDGRINMLRSILTSRGADGYEVEGGFDNTKSGIGKPGDLSAVMGFESGDGSDVNVYIMDGTPNAGGGGF